MPRSAVLQDPTIGGLVCPGPRASSLCTWEPVEEAARATRVRACLCARWKRKADEDVVAWRMSSCVVCQGQPSCGACTCVPHCHTTSHRCRTLSRPKTSVVVCM